MSCVIWMQEEYYEDREDRRLTWRDNFQISIHGVCSQESSFGENLFWVFVTSIEYLHDSLVIILQKCLLMRRTTIDFFFTSVSRRSYSLWIISLKAAKGICFEMKHPLPHRCVSVFRIASLTPTPPSLSLSFTRTHTHAHTHMYMQIYYATKIFSLLTRQIMLDYPTCLPINFYW